MRVLIDTDVLVDYLGHADRGSDSKSVIDALIETKLVEPWVAAQSLCDIERLINQTGDKKGLHAAVTNALNYFSIIPLRTSAISSALDSESSDFRQTLQAASAQSFKIDCILSDQPEQYQESSIPVMTAAQLAEDLEAKAIDTQEQVPFLDLKAQQHQIYNAIDDRLTDIITNTGFILGSHVDEFEKEFAALHQCAYCIGVSSGTDALHIALLAMGIGPGDEVMVPVNTFIATAEAVSLTGARPVFVDCDAYFNMDTSALEKMLERESGNLEEQKVRRAEGEKIRKLEVERVSKGIKAVIAVHLYGQPANMDEIMALAEKYDLMVIEDSCQAHMAEWKGRKVGGLGAFGAFSFYPGKNLGAYGEAGALICNDEALYQKAKMLRQHGEIERYHHQVIGHNYRMEAFQGAVLATKLKYIEEWTKKRRDNAELYNKYLGDIEKIETPRELRGTECVYHLYVIQADDRDALQTFLGENGIATGLHYPIPLHLQEAYRHLGYQKGDFPVAERAAERILSLPMYPELTEGQIRYVCSKIKAFYD